MNDERDGRSAADAALRPSAHAFRLRFGPHAVVDGTADDEELYGTDDDDTLNGSGGDDRLQGFAGDDHLDGGAGIDAVHYSEAIAAVIVDLAAGTARGGSGSDRLVSIENVWGSAFGDQLTGDGLGNELYGGPGDDALSGGDGDDTLNGGEGDDHLAGGAGTDFVDYSFALGGVNVDLGRGTASGADGNDTLTGIEDVFGTFFDDTLTGSSGDNMFVGFFGDDTIDGGGGDDFVGIMLDTPDMIDISYDPATGWLTLSSELEGTDRLRNVEYLLIGSEFFEVSQFTVRSAPTPLHFSPSDGARDVSVGSDFVVTFNEPVLRGTGTILLRDGTGAVVARFDAATSPELTYEGNHLRIDPAQPLKRDTAYAIEIGAGAVRDLQGETNPAYARYNFRTGPDLELSLPEHLVVDEGSGTLRIEVTLSEASTQPVNVSLDVQGATALPGADIAGGVRSVSFAPGQTSVIVELALTDDALFEPEEALMLRLVGPTGALLGDALTEATIVDNDNPFGAALPTDPLLARQWHLYPDSGVNVFPLWSEFDGRGVRVGVFDDGIDGTHADLAANVDASLGRTALDLSAGGAPVSVWDGHGTAVAGVIGAARNGSGAVGVAPGATLVSLYTGYTEEGTQEIENAFAYALGLDVLNNSWGFAPQYYLDEPWAFYDNFDDPAFAASGAALRKLAEDGRGGLGTVVVQSAGNSFEFGDDTNLHSFQNSRYIVTVAATGYDGAATGYTSPGASILVAAPGGEGDGSVGDILTTDRSGRAGYDPGDHVHIAGTSFSAPVVSGIVALMLQANPQLGYRDVHEILASSARITDDAHNDWRSNGGSGWNGGGLHYDAQDHDLGFGLVDAHAAVRLAETWRATPATAANAVEVHAARTTPVAIPDGSSSVSQSVQITEAIIVERIEVRVDIQHGYVGDLSLQLVSPSGTESWILSRAAQNDLSPFGTHQADVHFTFTSVLSLGESSRGRWSLAVFDEADQDAGTLQSWSLTLIGHADLADDLLVFTDEFGESAAAQPSRATLSDTGGIDTLNAAAISSASRIDLVDGAESWLDGHALTIATGTQIEHAVTGDGDDALLGNALANSLRGMRGNDELTGRGGDDVLDGGAGIDVARYTGLRAAYTLTHETSGPWRVQHGSQAGDGRDELVAIERIAFGDVSLALDTARDGHAGETAQILRALFGTAGLANHVYAGIGIKLLDEGISYDALVAAAIGTDTFAQLAGSRSNTDFVRLVYRNVVGTEPPASELASYVGLLDSGAFSQAELAAIACRADVNAASVELAGLADSGLAFLPWAG